VPDTATVPWWLDTTSCTADFQDCRTSRCCQAPTSMCYEKDEGWASCAPYCKKGVHVEDGPDYATPWTCRVLLRDEGTATVADPTTTTVEMVPWTAPVAVAPGATLQMPQQQQPTLGAGTLPGLSPVSAVATTMDTTVSLSETRPMRGRLAQ